MYFSGTFSISCGPVRTNGDTDSFMDAGCCSVSPRKHYILFSTKSPPSIQRIPWPTAPEDELYDRRGNRRYDYDSWVMNEDDFPWLVDPDGEYPS